MADKPTVDQLRARIDEINLALVTLLNERARIAREVGVRKGTADVYVPGREAAILARLEALNSGPLRNEDIRAIFSEIISACRAIQRQLTVAYLGPAGTYSEQAARRHLGAACDYMPHGGIDEVILAVEKDLASVAVVPVENSVEGPVGQTLDLLRTTSLSICGEVVLPIRHQLLSLAAGTKDVTEVAAHPQALAQCRRWLQHNLPNARLHSMTSNAQAAVWAQNHPDAGAIAGELAAATYELPILAHNIEDESSNSTRFLVLGPVKTQPTGNDRTSLLCSVSNEPGSLHRLLAVFADARINMTKLESRPVRDEPWQYVFFMDLDGHRDDAELQRALTTLRKHAAYSKILGSYPKVR